eukprot:3466781-Rhodomonas_salina.1
MSWSLPVTGISRARQPGRAQAPADAQSPRPPGPEHDSESSSRDLEPGYGEQRATESLSTLAGLSDCTTNTGPKLPTLSRSQYITSSCNTDGRGGGGAAPLSAVEHR